jgi:periplasmic divalent cation tolerance protein
VEVILVMTNLPDEESAARLAQHLVSENLVACVNVLAPCSSTYRWHGKIETAREIPLLAKTSAGNYKAVEQAILSLHSYELPEIIAVPVTAGLPGYLNWIETNVRSAR